MSSKLIKAAVLGHPVMQSKSPLIHNYWIQQHGLDGQYTAIDVSPAHFESKVRHLFDDEDYAGFNVTVPHKEAALALCDEVDEVAQKIGAVNTLYKKIGKIYGTNTDAFGFVENIKDSQPLFEFSFGPAIVLGAGGAARAIVHGLLEEGVPEIRLYNRSREKAEAIAKGCVDPARVKVFDWADRSLHYQEAGLLVNATSLGMQCQPELDMDLAGLPETTLVSDIVYSPLYTKLLKSAKEQGNPVVTGIGMLLQQARPSFERWFNLMPEVDKGLMDLVLT